MISNNVYFTWCGAVVSLYVFGLCVAGIVDNVQSNDDHAATRQRKSTSSIMEYMSRVYDEYKVRNGAEPSSWSQIIEYASGERADDQEVELYTGKKLRMLLLGNVDGFGRKMMRCDAKDGSVMELRSAGRNGVFGDADDLSWRPPIK